MYAQNPVDQCHIKFRTNKPYSHKALPSYGKGNLFFLLK